MDNLKHLREKGWHWLTRLKKNRKVSLHVGQQLSITQVLIPASGQVVHLRGYDWIKVFWTVALNGDAEYWATSQLEMTLQGCADYALDAWQIEVYHRGLKQFTGIERDQFRLEIAQRNHIGLAIRAFVRLELHRVRLGISWFESKISIIREAIRAYLAHPHIIIHSTV